MNSWWFYTPKGRLLADSIRCLIAFTFHFIVVREGCLVFTNLPRYEIPRMFYPREGVCAAEPEGGPIVFTFHFIGVGNGTGGFKIRLGTGPF